MKTFHLVFTFCVLVGINTVNFYDRQVLGAVQEQVRKEWDLSDSQLGALGTAFILLYAVVGLPLGRLADRSRRAWLLAAGVGLWSALTFASGFARSFWTLFVLRLGVGVGEATCAPTATSLIGDLVRPGRRARAMSVFMLGLPLGLALSFFVSGKVAAHYGWQAAFFVAGAPGLVLAVAALFLLDPGRGGIAPAAAALPFVAVARRILRLPTMWWIILSGALHNFNMYALGTFIASFLIRYHQLDLAQAGSISALVYGCGALGIFAAGWLGDRAFRRHVRGRLTVAWVGMATSVPCLLLALAAPRGEVALCVLGLLPGCLLLYSYYGTVYATVQDLIEPSMRGTAMAIYFCAMYCLGAVLGPVATGWTSDFLARRAATADGASTVTELHKAVGLHDAMYLIPALSAVLVLVLFAGSRTVARDCLRTTTDGSATSPRTA
ncbi:MAG TPA: MFS transporter [Gemmataceae bacterium]|nr:MFS transporter [Gemmataceae bacterium]